MLSLFLTDNRRQRINDSRTPDASGMFTDVTSHQELIRYEAERIISSMDAKNHSGTGSGMVFCNKGLFSTEIICHRTAHITVPLNNRSVFQFRELYGQENLTELCQLFSDSLQ
ncbi:hypothetical protein [Mucilaginibacter conchicola]|uniref:hypothetical protein n=1 Tax=Mucilaginibacter conchicola TaxID=2303333 RepID=UPI0011C0CDB1|nr:hypothetical protein [Mucilaginibacter conchicola]